MHGMDAVSGLRQSGMDAAGNGAVVFNQQDAHGCGPQSAAGKGSVRFGSATMRG
jgi:hypothetical protein